jgi:hypothetical protein
MSERGFWMSRSVVTVLTVALYGLFVAPSGVDAADQYSAGNITWDDGTSSGWSSAPGGPYGDTWVSGNDAIFEANGIATVTEPITLTQLIFNGPNMSITGAPLNFLPGGSISNLYFHPSPSGMQPNTCTISCGISGSPTVHLVRDHERNDRANTKNMRFAPSANSTQALGQVWYRSDMGGSQAVDVYLAGESANNTIASMYCGPNHSYSKLFIVEGPGKWTINGEMNTSTYTYNWRVVGGTLIVNGWGQMKIGLTHVEGGRLGGNGKIGGNQGSGQTATLEIRAGGILSPGDGGAGTLTLEWGDSNTDSALHMMDGSIYEFDVGKDTNDVLHVDGDFGSSRNTLIDLDNFILRIQDAGGKPKASDPLPVFTYESDVSVDMTGFGNTAANFDLLTDPGVKRWGNKGLSLTNDVVARTVYLVGLEKPAAGLLLIFQ